MKKYVLANRLLFWSDMSTEKTQKKRNKITTKAQTQVAIILWIKELPKYLYQEEADFLLTSRGLRESFYVDGSWALFAISAK